MGVLMFLGMVGSILASGYTIKKEFESSSIDNKIKPYYNGQNDEQNKIKYNFTSILKRCNIKYNKVTGRPIVYEPLPCIAYLRQQGYKEKEIKFFQNLYDKEYEKEKQQHFNNIKKEHQTLLNDINNQKKKKYYTFNIINYHEKTKYSFEKRAKIMLKNNLWRQLVDNYSYYYYNHNLIEVWNLYIPFDMPEKNVRKIYMEVCEKQNIHNSIK